MKQRQLKLAREQLDETLKQFYPLRKVAAPRKGWICAIRSALGMTGQQLARRLFTNKQRVSRIEQDELQGKVTLKTLRHVAEALDCTFVYGFVPHDSLDNSIRKQAEKIAGKRMSISNQTMRLEMQELGDLEKQKVMASMVEEIIATMPKSLWDQ